TIGLARTIIPGSLVMIDGSLHVFAPSVEVRTVICEVHQVSPGRTRLNSHTVLSGPCQITGLPSGSRGLGVKISGRDHVLWPLGNRDKARAGPAQSYREPP